MSTTIRISELRWTTVTVPFREPEIWSGGSRKGITSTVVEVLTDCGISGTGEIVPAPTPQISEAALGPIRELLIGQNAFEIERLVHTMYSVGGLYPFARMGNCVIGGIEMALWDILGKALTRPVYTFFGGPVRSEIQYIFFVQRKALDRMQADAQKAVGAGFRTIYTKVGLNSRTDVEAVRALREAIGPDVRLRVDANEAWSPGTALNIIRLMECFDIEYVEQPIAMGDIENLRMLRERTNVPIAANQSSWTNHDLFRVLASGAVDIVMTDPHQAGGLHAFKKAAGIAEAAGVPIVFHSFGPLAITTCAAQHVIASSSNFMLDNQTYNHMLVDDVVTVPPIFQHGALPLPQSPGIGVELDRDKLARYAELYVREGYCSAYDTRNKEFAKQKWE
jgi:L-alanine-DL-glutamate epimerase-like enolase superfamily enzyme